LRHELPAHEGRGVDELPAGLRQRLAETLVRELDAHELRRAFTSSVGALLDEAQRVDPEREQRLRETVWNWCAQPSKYEAGLPYYQSRTERP
jgi:hypothetical protein